MAAKTTSPICTSCKILKLTPFIGCSPDVLKTSFPGKKFIHFERNDLMFREMDSADGVFCLYSGKVKVSKKGKDQKEYITRLATPGCILGLSLFTSKFYANTAIALEKSAACFIHKDEFIPFIKNNPDVLIQVMKHLCYEIEVVEQKISGITHKTSRQRLAETLLMFRSTYGTDKNNFLKIALPIQDLANYIRISECIMKRVINSFVQENIINVKGQKIQLLEVDKLYEIARAQAK
jgi:CRP/FNR family transcriptional regulator